MWFHCVLYLHLDNQIIFLLYFLIGMYVYFRRKRKLSCFNSSLRNKNKSSAFLLSQQYHFWTTIRDNLFTKDPDTSPKKRPSILSIKVLKSKPERKRSELGERKYKWKGKEVGGEKKEGKRKGRKILIEQQNKFWIMWKAKY